MHPLLCMLATLADRARSRAGRDPNPPTFSNYKFEPSLSPDIGGETGLRNIKYKLSIVYRGHRCVRNRWYGPNAMVVSQKPEIVVNSFGIRIWRAVAYEC